MNYIILPSILGVVCILCEVFLFVCLFKEQEKTIDKYMFYFCYKYNIEEDLREIDKL